MPARGRRAVSSVGRAPRLHRGCREFEPLTAHQPRSSLRVAGCLRGRTARTILDLAGPSLNSATLRETYRADARGGVAQLVRVPACHAGGRGFEPRRSRQFSRSPTISCCGEAGRQERRVSVPDAARPVLAVHRAGRRNVSDIRRARSLFRRAPSICAAAHAACPARNSCFFWPVSDQALVATSIANNGSSRSRYDGQSGRSGAFGSPVLTKFTP